MPILFVPDTETVNNPEFVVSAKGKFMLTRHGYNFTATKRGHDQNMIRTHWRCTFKGSKTERGCRASAVSIEGDGIAEATFKGFHSHMPGKRRFKAKRHFKNKRLSKSKRQN